MMIKKVSEAYKKNLALIIFGPLLKIIEAVFDLFIPLFMKAIIDLSQYDEPSQIPNAISQSLARFIRVFSPGDAPISDAITGGIIILVMGVVGFVITMVAQYLAAVTSTNVGNEVRNSLYNKILHMSKKDRDEITNAKLLTVINSDTYQLEKGVLLFVRLIIRAPFILLGALILSFVLDWRVGIAFTVIVPLIVLVNILVLRKSSIGYVEIQKDLDELSSSTSEVVEGSRVVRASNNQEASFNKYSNKTSSYEAKSIKVNKINALINPLTFALTSIVLIVIIYLLKGDLFSSSNVLIASTIIAEMSYLAQIFFTTVQITQAIIEVVKAGVSSHRIDDVLAKEESIISGDKTNEDGNYPLIKFNHVNYSFNKDDNYFLTDLDFEVRKGETLGIIGGTGSGKSTLINLMERFIDVTSGEILYQNTPIKEYDLKSLRNDIGLVNQKASLFKGSIYDNMKMSNPIASEEEIIDALKKAEAYEFVSKYEDGIKHEINEGATNLSGGQKQRLSIARALVKHPKILILDDSTSALDLLTDKRIRSQLNEMKDTTKIIVSQRVATIQNADYILVLEGGKIVERGKHQELMKNSSIYKEIYETQVKKD
ncbi:MAG: ABC transporter ATP-binding protein [Erysipelotrichaceae bacterium]|nr:ABC transporter ATP-binding protein [Erysipelotrichaceae bacterium]